MSLGQYNNYCWHLVMATRLYYRLVRLYWEHTALTCSYRTSIPLHYIFGATNQANQIKSCWSKLDSSIVEDTHTGIDLSTVCSQSVWRLPTKESLTVFREWERSSTYMCGINALTSNCAIIGANGNWEIMMQHGCFGWLQGAPCTMLANCFSKFPFHY